MKTKLPDLVIGDIKINPPIIQGGMGVKVSTAALAAAVSNEGGMGVIASVGLGGEKQMHEEYEKVSETALREQIRKAKKLTGGHIGVNIMFALTNYESLAKASAEEGADVIISGAGLPIKLPSYVEGSRIKLIPIISSGRAAGLICEAWRKRYDRLPDAIVIEGPLAGGHLGFRFGELISNDALSLEKILPEVIAVTKRYESRGIAIPVIVAGGIFTGKDMARMLKLGANGVQMATRFVCTTECEVSSKYKEAYLNCCEDDIKVILSPVGMPARVINNRFVDRIESGEKMKFNCPYKCLKTCDPYTVNYCIADALVKSARGDLDNGIVMCAANAYRVKKIISVRDLMNELVEECSEELGK